MAARIESTPSGPPTGEVPAIRAGQVPTMRSVPASLVMVGVVVVLVAAWGGLVAYVGPSFGFSGDGTAAWRWTTPHLFLALLPAVLAFVSGLLLVSIAPRTIDGRGRADLALLGTATVISGAWFLVGPLAWPVIRTTGPYFITATPFHELTFELGYSVGPGALLVACGGFVIGWAVRHQRPIGPAYPAFVAVPAPVPAAVPAEYQPSPTAVPAPDLSVPPAVDGPPPMPEVVGTTLVGVLPDGEPPVDPTLTGVVPAVRPDQPAPDQWEQRSGRPVPIEPDLTGSWPAVPPPGPAAPPSAPPPGWRVPDVTGPVEEP